MTIARGVTLGPYEILTRIGEGGMGEVWKARDSRIGRDVAIKVLTESFTAGDQRVWRFEQEARAAGALNHPGLVTIFDVGTTNGSPYIVMELLEGQTLRDAIGEPGPAPLPLRRAIDYAIQIASALAVAHDKGIIHRDLKPENIFITSEGRVKILDFGLAKLTENTDMTVPVAARHLTSAGIVVGTPGYMSPEQVRAQALDHRTDIFSFGSVLYEMLTGRPAFECNSAIETMHAILNVEPPALTTIDSRLPASLDAIVLHCLEKNPRDRFQSARDLAFQLRMMPETQQTVSDIRPLPSIPATSMQRRRRLSIAAWSAFVAGLLALAAGGFALYRAGTASPRAAARTFKQLTFADGVEMFPSLAPDGKSFVYVSAQSGNRDIFVQRVDGRSASNLTSDSLADDSEPAFSPDGGQIAFRSERDGGGIYVMLVTGESVRRLTDFGHNPSWSPDGTKLVVSTAGIELQPNIRQADGELWIIDARTGARQPLLRSAWNGFPRGMDAVQPSWSPHGNRIAYWSVYSGRREIVTIDPNAQTPSASVVKAIDDPGLHWNPVWSPDGKHLYYGSDRDGTLNLWRVPIDEESGKAKGPSEPQSLPGAFSGNFTISHRGEIAFTSVTRSYRILAVPFDKPAGYEPRPLLGGSEEIVSFDISPDGSTIAFTTGGVQEDLFVVNADGTRTRQLTNDAARDRGVRWSPDGKTLFLYSNRDGGYHIWSIRADGSNLTRLTDAAMLGRIGRTNAYSFDLSPDGRTLAVDTQNGTNALIHLDRPAAQRAERIPDLGSAGIPRWSPDGQRLARATEHGITVYSLATRRVETVLPHGSWPQWFPDNRRLLFFDDQRVGILDVGTRRETTRDWTPLPGVRLDHTSALSRDGSTLYVRQKLEHADVWLVRMNEPGR